MYGDDSQSCLCQQMCLLLEVSICVCLIICLHCLSFSGECAYVSLVNIYVCVCVQMESQYVCVLCVSGKYMYVCLCSAVGYIVCGSGK